MQSNLQLWGMKDKIIEQNEMIAEFMGGYCHAEYNLKVGMNIPFLKDQWFDYKDMQFHSSWEWLMEVVEKCHNLRNQDENIFDLYSGFVLDETPIWVPIEKVYERVVAFIKEYNEHEKA